MSEDNRNQLQSLKQEYQNYYALGHMRLVDGQRDPIHPTERRAYNQYLADLRRKIREIREIEEE